MLRLLLSQEQSLGHGKVSGNGKRENALILVAAKQHEDQLGSHAMANIRYRGFL